MILKFLPFGTIIAFFEPKTPCQMDVEFITSKMTFSTSPFNSAQQGTE
jgi:hypothetical protein